ncbi:MAG: PHB depolymerase family esterase [Rhodoferax sp.]|nr:PHB depolymerase family esterase [Rhodoferax sp.]MDP3652147.1 PHB depolymerase family esterase [Rhodoferax sp.]
MNEIFQELMRKATQLTHKGRLKEATAAIQRALRGTSAESPAPAATPGGMRPEATPLVLDGCVFEVHDEVLPPQTAKPTPGTGKGTETFISGTHTHAGLTRRYKLYQPPGHQGGKPLPLVVMLHGCTQNPDDFAAGTRMNDQARAQGFFVLYPEQPQEANPSRCWNWFKHNHQQRGRGEPALLTSLTQTVMQEHGMDARRVYVAGLSAGGAMAAIVAAAYPELFAAVGVHSGLPNGSASNVAEALMVMQSGKIQFITPPKTAHGGAPPKAPLQPKIPIPTIVFHGDQDQTVHPRNGEQVIAAALAGAAGADPTGTFPPGSARVEQGVSAQGRRYTRSTQHGDRGQALTEHWLVHGAGHAWSGGHGQGSYTDATGPDATREMLRFFFEHPKNLPH